MTEVVIMYYRDYSDLAAKDKPYYAYVEGFESEKWIGRTADEAIGALIRGQFWIKNKMPVTITRIRHT